MDRLDERVRVAGAGVPMLDGYRRLFDAVAPSAVAIGRGTLPDTTDRQRRDAACEVVESLAPFETVLPLLSPPGAAP